MNTSRTRFLILNYIILFDSVKTVKEIAFDLGYDYEYISNIKREWKNTGFFVVASKLNRDRK